MRAVMTAGSLQRRRQFGQADRAVAIAVELAEHIVGLREVGAAGAECVFKFRFGDLAIAIAVDLREQILQERTLVDAGVASTTGFAQPAVRSSSPAKSANPRRTRWPGSGLRKPGPDWRPRMDWPSPGQSRSMTPKTTSQRLNGVQRGRRGAKGKQHGRTPTDAAASAAKLPRQIDQQTPCHRERPVEQRAFPVPAGPSCRQLMPGAAEFSGLSRGRFRRIAPGLGACYGGSRFRTP